MRFCGSVWPESAHIYIQAFKSNVAKKKMLTVSGGDFAEASGHPLNNFSDGTFGQRDMSIGWKAVGAAGFERRKSLQKTVRAFGFRKITAKFPEIISVGIGAKFGQE